ncbi:MAG: manganese-binding transcriptional regulator MntR [Alphaproteobacteria bacterium]
MTPMAAAESDKQNDKLEHLRRPSKEGALIDPDQHARQHRHTREANQAEVTEDYVELIADLIDATGEARLTDLAERLAVTPATAGKVVARLKRDGLVISQPYRSIFLTEDGKAMAAESRRRHRIVLNFLLAAGVPEDAALLDAEGIEHHVSDATLDALEKLTGKLSE